MKGNYIGVKPSPYSKAQSRKQGVWEIYDQEQLAKTSSWQVQAPWDVSTGYFNLDPLLNRNWFQVATGENAPHEIVFKPDGTRFYITGNNTDRIYQYHCSTPWDIRTAYCSPYSYSVTNQDGIPLGLYIKPDGTKLYVVGQVTDQVYEYDFIVPWEVGTLTYTGKSFSIAAQEGDSRNVVFKDDGTKFYVIGTTNDKVYQYSCSTAWDVSTASYDSKSFNANTNLAEGAPTGLAFGYNGSILYVTGQNGLIYQVQLT